MAPITKPDVLIIDDDADICEIFKTYCEETKMFNKVVVANDGSMATFKLQNQKFGVIILDMNMPKKSGIDVLIREFAAKNQKNTKDCVLVISGNLDPDIVAKLIHNGVKNFLVKPVDEAIFKEKIIKMIS